MTTTATHPAQKPLIQQAEIRRALSVLIQPGNVFEIRAINASIQANSNYVETLSGYFDNADAAIKQLARLHKAEAVYITLNPCHTDLLARAANVLVKAAKGGGTSDNLIMGYSWLLIDGDPDRVSGISSTEAEHEQALSFVRHVKDMLTAQGWPASLDGDSGNGAHLLYRLDLPTSDSDLIKRVIEGLAERFDIHNIHIDRTVFNPSRMCKLYGTRACKGSDTEQRPHRMSRLLEIPNTIQCVSREQLESIAVSPATNTSTTHQTRASSTLDGQAWLEQWISDKHIDIVGDRQTYQDGYKWQLTQCPFCGNSDHNANIFYTGRGCGFKCSHNSCSSIGWKEFRAYIEPTAYTTSTSPRSTLTRDTEPLLHAITSTSNGNGGKRTNTSGHVGTAQVDPHFVLDCLYQGEWGDSLLFAHLFNGKAVYDHTEKEWYLWHKHAWARDETGRVKHLVSGHLASVYLVTAAEIVKEAKFTEDKEQQQKLNKKVSTLSQRALELRSVARCRNVLYFAASHEGMGIAAKQWDTNKWLLAVPNGVIDLKTGQCRDGKAEDYIRTISPTEWLGLDTPCPRFEQFLQEIFEDRAPHEQLLIIQFIQRLFGYAITGETIEHIFAVFYGEDGRNGKDTLQRAISHALGQVSGVISKDVLLDTGRMHNAGSATPHLSDLQGKRIAWANEPEKGARFSTGQVKDLSGGGDITTRSPYEKRFYTFTPSHFLILLTNHKPRAHADDSAFWDRLRLITFHMRFVDKPSETNERKKDTTLWHTLELEAPGILAWLVRGCLQWQAQGIDTPVCVTHDAQEYRKEEDMLSLFIDECCVIGPGKTARASQIFKAYTDWCKSGGLDANAMTRTQFGKLLSKKYPKERQNTGFEYLGIGLVHSSVGFEDNYTQAMTTDEKPLEEDNQANGSVGCVGFLQENTKFSIGDTEKGYIPVKTIHTIHEQDSQSGVNGHGKPIDGTFETLHNYTRTIHASEELDANGFARFCAIPGCNQPNATGGNARCEKHWQEFKRSLNS